MRCEKGDAAIIIRGASAGAMVTRLEFVPAATFVRTGQPLLNAWAVEYRDTTAGPSGLRWGVEDSNLFPIPRDLLSDEVSDEAPVDAKREAFPGVDIDAAHAKKTTA